MLTALLPSPLDPTCPNPRPSVLPLRPAANSTLSGRSGLAPSVLTVSTPRRRAMAADPALRRIFMPPRWKQSTSASEISWSMKGSSTGPMSTSVT